MVISPSLQLSYEQTGDKDLAEGATLSTTSGPTVSKEFHLDDIKGHVYTTQRITIPLFVTINVPCKTNIRGHCMWVHVLAELVQVPQLPTGSFQVLICLRNLNAHPTMIPAKVIIGKVSCSCKLGAISNPHWNFWVSLPLAPQGAGSWTNWTYRVWKSGTKESRIRPGNCWWNRSIFLPAVTWTWEKCLWLTII